MPLSIQTVDSLAGLRVLEPEWRDLWHRDPAATPFHGPDWLVPWTQYLWGGGRLRVLAVRDGSALIAVAPFFLWGYGRHPEIIRVSFLGSGITDHLGITADPARDVEAAQAILDYFGNIPDAWHVCDLQELRPGCPLLRADLPRGLAAQDSPCGVCPVIALPKSWDDLAAGLDAKFRRNLHVAGNRLRHDQAEFTRVAPHEVEDAVRELIRLHEARWQQRREIGMLATAALHKFHLEAAARLARLGAVRLYTLKVAGETIAVQYNLRRDSRVYAYLSGFDPAHQRNSPGAALLAHSIRCAIEEGATHFDFLRNREEFKYQWGARDRVNRKLIVSHSAAYARDVA
jgi:CelD/BcsL family acetyltransferase involved in cellulose biosynthesis